MAPRVIVVGGGHNGLACAAYLARGGCEATLVERRGVLGGACVTEEIWPGFKVSRAAYVVSLLRPAVVRELGLRDLGLELIPREPASITLLPDGRSLVLGSDGAENARAVGRFSARDADRLAGYERFVEGVARAIESTLDTAPPDWPPRSPSALLAWTRTAAAFLRLGRDLTSAVRLLIAPARQILEEWFDSEPLRATLATDAVIGAWASPSEAGTGSVLLHHSMGNVTGRRGVWAYVRGGMGGLARALADAARAAGATLRTDSPVSSIVVREGRAAGVVLESGERLDAHAVVSGVDPYRTFVSLVGPAHLPESFVRAVRHIDFRSPVVKINLALDGIPPFRLSDGATPPLGGTIHLGCEDLDAIDRSFDDARGGRVSARPLVELTIPSLLDATLAPAGRHVASIFAQYAPVLPAGSGAWATVREQMRERAFGMIEEVAPGFRDRILECEVLAAPDLEDVFGLTGGNIFHGAMTPDRLLSLRPVPGWSAYRTPLPGLFLCGAGTHPGGGVMGACGRNAAREVLRSLRRELQGRGRKAEP